MADRVVLHVGTPKAGTTFLQTLMWANRPALREAGVLIPGDRAFHHNLAATAVRSGFTAPRATEVWERMLEETRTFPGTVLYSNEWFSQAGPAKAAQALEAFGDARVDVVVTARDLVSVVPAGWQESLKLGAGTSLPEFIDGLPAARQRWSYWTLDPAWVLRRWAGGLDPAQAHVVTVPTSRSNPNLLWERFAAVTGIPDGVVDLATSARTNESIGVTSARLLEVLGPRLREASGYHDDIWAGYRWLRRYISHTLLVPRGGGRIGLSVEQYDAIRERTRTAVRQIRAAGYDVVGDLDELTSAPHDTSARRPDQVPDAEVLDAAADLIGDLLRDLRTSSDTGTPVPDNREFD